MTERVQVTKALKTPGNCRHPVEFACSTFLWRGSLYALVVRARALSSHALNMENLLF